MSGKRKLPLLELNRRVRARRQEDWEPEAATCESGDSDHGEDDDASEASTSKSESHSQEEASESDAEAPPKVDTSSISFGALARAQASLAPSSRSKNPRSKSPLLLAPTSTRRKPDSKPQSKPKRSSKHAPQEITSKKPVSRRRDLPSTSVRAKPRDPRFDSLVNQSYDEVKARRAYAFLDEYRDSEVAELRAQAKRTKDADAKEQIKRRIMSLESKKRAQQRKDDEMRLLAEHRRQEKELVAQGKKPFYLKRSEQKKQLLTKRFESLTKSQVDRAIERKRKKVAGQEKKELGALQRVRSRH
ncbi:hypothetical protein CDD81_7372 [Ophiocordyceps australis]|uniref:rRNA biogenesis protein RRP36 n=1 Tax=Ophiocordyceps australis TaxID=1399860 RepID=A0A2C5XGV7_9HYPO|nr:hypothetical protein CDD81_7372 [Ophiocordyceps australis]